MGNFPGYSGWRRNTKSPRSGATTSKSETFTAPSTHGAEENPVSKID